MKAPFSRPNNSLSTSPDGRAAQFTFTITRLPRGLSRWIAWAISSLPVPVSPRTSTVASVGATCSTRRSTFWIGDALPGHLAVAPGHPHLRLEIVGLGLETILQLLDLRVGLAGAPLPRAVAR